MYNLFTELWVLGFYFLVSWNKGEMSFVSIKQSKVYLIRIHRESVQTNFLNEKLRSVKLLFIQQVIPRCNVYFSLAVCIAVASL